MSTIDVETLRHAARLAGFDFTTAELKANVFAAGHPGDVLHAVGEPLHVGRRTQVWEVRIKRNGEARNAAFFSCTQLVLAASGA